MDADTVASPGTQDGTKSVDLRPGMQLRHRDGAVVTLARRKESDDEHHGLPFRPGWWLVGGGGLADLVIDDPKSAWQVTDEDVLVEPKA